MILSMGGPPLCGGKMGYNRGEFNLYRFLFSSQIVVRFYGAKKLFYSHKSKQIAGTRGIA